MYSLLFKASLCLFGERSMCLGDLSRLTTSNEPSRNASPLSSVTDQPTSVSTSIDLLCYGFSTGFTHRSRLLATRGCGEFFCCLLCISLPYTESYGWSSGEVCRCFFYPTTFRCLSLLVEGLICTWCWAQYCWIFLTLKIDWPCSCVSPFGV
jgi:hypothetical protein